MAARRTLAAVSVSFKNCMRKEGCITLLDNMPDREGDQALVKFYAQSCLTLCDPMDCSPPGSSVHGIIPARIQEWVAIPFSRGSSQPRD